MEPTDVEKSNDTKETSEETEKAEEDALEVKEDAEPAKADQTAPAEEHDDDDAAAMAAVPAPSARIDSETGESEEAATTTPADS